MKTIKAQLNGLRIAPRKVRLVAGLLKRKDVPAALDQLAFITKRSSEPVRKLLESAAANAQAVHHIDRDQLRVKEIRVDEGMKLKRYQPKGFGRANPIQKKTSRISIVLEQK